MTSKRTVPITRTLLLLNIILHITTNQVIATDKCTIIVNDLPCDRLKNPLGIDSPMPQLAWEMISQYRGQIQSAYQIIVSSSVSKLDDNNGDLWN